MNGIMPKSDERAVGSSDQILLDGKIWPPETDEQNRMRSVKREGWRGVNDRRLVIRRPEFDGEMGGRAREQNGKKAIENAERRRWVVGSQMYGFLCQGSYPF